MTMRRQHGMLLPVVVFIMVIVGAIIASVATLLVRANSASDLDLRSARALQAARAAVQWGAWQVRDPQGTLSPGPSALPACPADTTLALGSPMEEFNVVVICTRTPATGAIDEGGLMIAVYELNASATASTLLSATRVERRVQMRIETCKDQNGSAPNYAC